MHIYVNDRIPVQNSVVHLILVLSGSRAPKNLDAEQVWFVDLPILSSGSLDADIRYCPISRSEILQFESWVRYNI